MPTPSSPSPEQRLCRLGGHLAAGGIAAGAGPLATAGAAGTGRLKILFVGVDGPHGCAWRTSLESVGAFDIVGFVAGFGGTIASLEEKYMALPRFETVSAALAALDFGARSVADARCPQAPGRSAFRALMQAVCVCAWQ